MDDQNSTSDQPTTSAAEPGSQLKCATCSQAAAGYKCTQCGEESDQHDENHACGGAMCQPKCVNCSQAESKCTCQPVTQDSGAAPGSAAPAI